MRGVTKDMITETSLKVWGVNKKDKTDIQREPFKSEMLASSTSMIESIAFRDMWQAGVVGGNGTCVYIRNKTSSGSPKAPSMVYNSVEW